MKLSWPALLVAVVLVLLLAPTPVSWPALRWPALMQELENAAHAPVFALLTWIAFRQLRRKFPSPSPLPWIVCIVAMPAVGLLTEWLQRLTGRDASWTDLGHNLLGILFALLLLTRAGLRAPAARHALSVVAVAVAGFGLAPLAWAGIAYVERWRAEPVIWRGDSPLLRHFSYVQYGDYPGLVLTEVPPDWRNFATLEVDVESHADAALDVTLRTHDAPHRHFYEDRFNEAFRLQPHERRRVRFSLERIRTAPQGREMQLARMRGIAIFHTDPPGSPLFEVHEIRLAH